MSFYHEGYHFVPWRLASGEKGVDGEELDAFEHALPEEVYCEPLGRIGFGGTDTGRYDDLCFVRWSKDFPEPPGMRTVPSDLEKLLRAGRLYKPAIAIANEARSQEGSEDWSEAEAVERFTDTLRDELDNQRDRPFFLAKALRPSHIGYRRTGDYCWILDYDPDAEEPIGWVTSDYWIYTDPVTDFDIDVSWLAERFAVRAMRRTQ